LHLLFQNLESLIDIVIANEHLHVPSIHIVAVSLGEAVSDACRPSIEDVIDDIGEYYRREDIGQRRSDL
jgi:hypothetical protein